MFVFLVIFFDESNQETEFTFVSSTQLLILPLKELKLKIGSARKDDDLVFSQHDRLVQFAKTVQIDPIFGKRVSTQIACTFVHPDSPQGVFYSAGNLQGIATEQSDATYNSLEGTCGAIITNGENHAVGMHIGTKGTRNTFVAFSVEHFLNFVDAAF